MIGRMHIPLYKPYWGKKEEQAVVAALRTTIGTGDGIYTERMSTILQKILRTPYIFPVTSCTHAMDLMIAILRVGSGDEVIVPSFTMTSTANCVVLAGAKPVFADIDPKTYNIDPDDIERVITKRTRGIIVVHYAGMACDMKRILTIARRHKLFVIEDAAHAIGASLDGKALGTFGTAGAFSFHGTKNISCGEGGVLVTNSRSLVPDIDIYRANGTNRNAFLKGKISKYEWVGPGTSYFLSDILASIVCTQLTQLSVITSKRRVIASAYTKAFRPFGHLVQLPTIPVGAKPNWHIYALKFTTVADRIMFQKAMKKAGIEVSTHYVPLHSAPMGKTCGGGTRRLPVTDDVAGTLVRMPIYAGMIKKELAYVITAAVKMLKTF